MIIINHLQDHHNILHSIQEENPVQCSDDPKQNSSSGPKDMSSKTDTRADSSGSSDLLEVHQEDDAK